MNTHMTYVTCLCHRWDYSETCQKAFGRLFTSHRKAVATLDADQEHILDLIKAAQPLFPSKDQNDGKSDEHEQRSIEDIYNRHRRRSLYAIADKARMLALRVTEKQRARRTQNLKVASTITSSILTDMATRYKPQHYLSPAKKTRVLLIVFHCTVLCDLVLLSLI